MIAPFQEVWRAAQREICAVVLYLLFSRILGIMYAHPIRGPYVRDNPFPTPRP
jgi:hypothetical protein